MLWSTLTSFIFQGFALIEEPLQINSLQGSAIPHYLLCWLSPTLGAYLLHFLGFLAGSPLLPNCLLTNKAPGDYDSIKMKYLL